MSRLKKYTTAVAIAMSILFCQTVLAKDVGKVNFPISCKKASQTVFNNALSLLHNMMYIQAEDAFEQIIKNDPDCAMAYWGIALTQIHPLWPGSPSEEALERGSSAIQKAEKNPNTDKREKAFIEALAG